MAQSKQIALSHPDQVDAFDAVKEQIKADVEDLDEEVREWAGEVTDGEAVRIACEAYRGNLSFRVGEAVSQDPNLSDSKRAESEEVQSVIERILRRIGISGWF